MMRHVTQSDMSDCLRIIEHAHQSSAHYRGEFSRERTAESLLLRILNPYSLVLVTEGCDGLLIACAAESSYSNNLKTTNEFLYAQSGGGWLIKAYVKWARGFGPNTEINFCTSYGGVEGEKAASVLARLGFSDIGKQLRIF